MAIVISGVNNNDKITASDGTIDLLSGVSYSGIITAPAFTTPGNLTAGHINVGSNIQLGNAGVVTATTFVGNLTGNINNTTLLLQTGGYERVRIKSDGKVGVNTTSEITYKLYIQSYNSTYQFNYNRSYNDDNAAYTYRGMSTITIQEILPAS